MVRDTSLMAFTKILPTLSKRQETVYRIFKQFPSLNFTNAEVADMLGVQHHTVSPRVAELRDMGLIVEVSRRVCTVTHNTAWCKRLKQ